MDQGCKQSHAPSSRTKIIDSKYAAVFDLGRTIHVGVEHRYDQLRGSHKSASGGRNVEDVRLSDTSNAR